MIAVIRIGERRGAQVSRMWEQGNVIQLQGEEIGHKVLEYGHKE